MNFFNWLYDIIFGEATVEREDVKNILKNAKIIFGHGRGKKNSVEGISDIDIAILEDGYVLFPEMRNEIGEYLMAYYNGGRKSFDLDMVKANIAKR